MDPQLIPFGWGLFKDEEEVEEGKTIIRKALFITN